jgi:hypothetical protein
VKRQAHEDEGPGERAEEHRHGEKVRPGQPQRGITPDSSPSSPRLENAEALGLDAQGDVELRAVVGPPHFSRNLSTRWCADRGRTLHRPQPSRNQRQAHAPPRNSPGRRSATVRSHPGGLFRNPHEGGYGVSARRCPGNPI